MNKYTPDQAHTVDCMDSWAKAQGLSTYSELSTELAKLRTQRDELLEALEEARAGLRWYHDRNPGQTDGSDDEAMARIDAAIAKATQ